ncbi:MAG TPA: sugar O-acetyltransferase [Solirubrobacteraceae bacterium]|nr:sugar O-acetyltransferase [Solirubrobacteraceae bacterium]
MSLEKERMLRGEPYLANHPDLLEERKQCRLLCERFNAISFGETAARRVVLRELLGRLGEEAEVMAPFQCDYGRHISVGARTFINYNAVVLDGAAVTIGEDVQIGPGVQLLTALHPLDPVERRRGTETAKPITIGDGAWLATGVIVCPGVTIGADTVVGAGSVVTEDLPAGHLCFGNPCRVIRRIASTDGSPTSAS